MGRRNWCRSRFWVPPATFTSTCIHESYHGCCRNESPGRHDWSLIPFLILHSGCVASEATCLPDAKTGISSHSRRLALMDSSGWIGPLRGSRSQQVKDTKKKWEWEVTKDQRPKCCFYVLCCLHDSLHNNSSDFYIRGPSLALWFLFFARARVTASVTYRMYYVYWILVCLQVRSIA